MNSHQIRKKEDDKIDLETSQEVKVCYRSEA